ncbi:serine hydrolase domain-containing protein [Pseudarthrobacter cellobiosi]|uniref:serine hydrolase domain-containing protein n=1 Tax=Pseudarthrobacter cellobiosi TaxID=2953654 RepID=UPI00208FBEA1|nr:serine hydrolase domain-containing protein [Pseudarthrobacter sp. HLT1-5]MCO4254046.1 beta-lactamase family protein [Pseudarthrobacter sp. HLT1-5]
MTDHATQPSGLAADVLVQLAQWPGAPSLAVVGAEGVLGSHDEGRVYRLASVTKLLTALTILAAAEQGDVSLDSPIGPPGSTLRHLLAHASGLGFEEDRVRAVPGARRIYSNRGMDMAAAYFSAQTGRPFERELNERVLKPLGMHRTSLAGLPSKGGMAPIGDLARLAHELLRPRTLANSVVAALSEVAFPGLAGILPGFGRQADNSWGLGAEVRGTKEPHWTSPHNSSTTFGHFGMAGSFLWVDREAGLACAALSTVDFGPWATDIWPAVSSAVLRCYRDLPSHTPARP